MELTRGDLLTIVGIAAVTSMIMQMLVKPWLTKRYADRWWHDVAINGITTALAIGLAIVGLYVNFLMGAPQDIAFAVIKGIVAAFTSVFGYEVVKNTFKFVGRNNNE